MERLSAATGLKLTTAIFLSATAGDESTSDASSPFTLVLVWVCLASPESNERFRGTGIETYAPSSRFRVCLGDRSPGGGCVPLSGLRGDAAPGSSPEDPGAAVAVGVAPGTAGASRVGSLAGTGVQVSHCTCFEVLPLGHPGQVCARQNVVEPTGRPRQPPRPPVQRMCPCRGGGGRGGAGE